MNLNKKHNYFKYIIIKTIKNNKYLKIFKKT